MLWTNHLLTFIKNILLLQTKIKGEVELLGQQNQEIDGVSIATMSSVLKQIRKHFLSDDAIISYFWKIIRVLPSLENLQG